MKRHTSGSFPDFRAEPMAWRQRHTNSRRLPGSATRVLAIACVLPLAACATKRDVRDLQTEVRALAMRQDSAVLALQATNRSLRDSLNVVSNLLFQFRGDVNNSMLTIQDQLIRIGELTGQSQRSLAGLRDQLDQQRRQATAPTPRTTPQQPGAQDDLVVGDDAQDLYNTGVSLFNRGNFTVATNVFRRFLEEFPAHELAPSAHLRLGELLAQENRLEEAAEEYLKVRELFPTASEVPDALYRAGAVYLEMEDFERARQYLEMVVNSYPDHAVARLAEDRLRDIP